ncbi:MAG TPA: sulfotransferase [Bryobacteraceae bacterium]|nr:sulfotransferase [Bryobacteraceae bacterium]
MTARTRVLCPGAPGETVRPFERGPIFLAGIDRSGIGILCELLESHPSIAMTRRTNFWSFFLNRFGDLSRRDNLDRCLTAMMRYTRTRVFRPDSEQLYRSLLDEKPTYPRLFALLEEGRARELGKVRWGDKSMNSEEYADTILTAYPGAKMIHIIRDPRDRYASLLTHRRVGRGGVAASTALWLRSARLAKRNSLKYPDRYRIVRFETVLSQPEATLRRICHFLGEEYSPAMLTVDGPPVSAMPQPDPDGGPTPRVVTTASIGRFRNSLSPREIAFIQRCTHRDMAEFGYRPEAVPLSLSGRILFYLADYPVNMTLMLCSKLHAATLKWLGRTPSARRIISECASSGAAVHYERTKDS